MSFANPIDFPEVWDAIIIGGRASPGVCTVEGSARNFKWDEKEGPGAAGATHTYRGDRPSHFKVKIKLWLAEHFDDWDSFREALRPDPKKGIKALDVLHPALEDNGIRAVVVESIGEVKHEGGGLYAVELGLVEYRPPPKANASGTPKGASSSSKGGSDGKGTAPPSAKTEQEKEIERLLGIARQP